MKVLYVTGTNADHPDATTEQLSRLSPDLQIKTVSSAAQALEETRASNGFRALLTSPWLAHNETLSLIVSLRRDRVPIAIVPVLTETQRDFFASAVAAGADDVLLLRGETLLRANETLTRIRQSPHLSTSGERRRLRVLYAGVDDRVWSLLEQVPFAKNERATVGAEGSCSVRVAGSPTSELRCDVVIIDQQPGDVHPLQVLKSVKTQASDLPVVVLAPPGASDVETAALDLGADDTVIKSGIYRRRLISTLRRFHQRAEIVAQHTMLRAREHRLRQIVESLPQGVGIIGEDLAVLAMNGTALQLFGAAKPTDVVGKDFRTFVLPEDREQVVAGLKRIAAGESAPFTFRARTPTGPTPVELRGSVLERDARGGRGVAAVFVPAVPAVAPAAQEELAALTGELESLRAAAAEAAARLDAERKTREDLQQRLAEAEADLIRRSEAEASLADTLTLERSAWDEARRALETRAGDAERARLEAARALEQTRAEAAETAVEHQRLAEQRMADAAQARRDAESTAGERDRARDDAAAAAAERDRLRHELEALAAEHHRLRQEADTIAAGQADARRQLEQELSRAREDLSSLQTRAAELDDLRAGLGARVAELERERHDLEARLAGAGDAHGEVDRLRAELEAACAERDRMHAEAEAACAERDRMHGEAEAARREHDLRASERDEARRALEARHADVQHLQGELDAVRAALDESRRLAEARTVELEHLRQAHDAATGDHRAVAEARQALEQELTALRQQLDDARLRADADRQALHAELDAVRARQASDESAWTTDRAAWQRELDAARHRAADAESRAADLEARVARLSADATATVDLQSTVEALQSDLRQLADDHASERAAWDGLRRELEQRAQQHEDRRRDLESAAGRQEARIAEADAKLASVSASLEAAEHRAAAAEGATAREAELRRAAEAEIASHEEALAAARAELGRLADARREHDRLEASLRAVRAEHDAVAAALEAERRFRQKDREEIEVVRQAFDHERGRRAALREQVTELEQEIAARREALAAELRSREGLEQEVARLRRELQAVSSTTETRARALDEALTAARNDLARVTASPLFGHARMTRDGRLVSCNDAFARLFGWRDATEALAQAGDAPFATAASGTALDDRLRADGRYDGVEVAWTRPGSRPVIVRESAAYVRMPDGRELVERLCVDARVTSRLEEELRQARRLEEVGSLAASMAPDIERRLAAVQDAARHLSDAALPGDARQQAADAARLGAAEAAALVRQLLAFSRRQVAPPDRADLAESVTRLEGTLRRLVGSHIDVQLDCRPSGAVVQNGDELDQLLTALMVASRDLLPVGGLLRIETDRVTLEADEVRGLSDARPGPHAVVAVSASGYGIQRAQASQVLDLLARRCGAWLRAANDTERQASLEIYFPLSE